MSSTYPREWGAMQAQNSETELKRQELQTTDTTHATPLPSPIEKSIQFLKCTTKKL